MKTKNSSNYSYKAILVALAASFFIMVPSYASHANQGPSGGTGGGSFNDWCRSSENLHELRVRSGSWLDAIQVSCINNATGAHRVFGQRGGNGGGLRIISFAPGEGISSITGYYSNYVRYLRIRTTNNRTFTFGKPVGRYFSYYKPKSNRISGFLGASGKYLDSIGVSWR